MQKAFRFQETLTRTRCGCLLVPISQKTRRPPSRLMCALTPVMTATLFYIQISYDNCPDMCHTLVKLFFELTKLLIFMNIILFWNS